MTDNTREALKHIKEMVEFAYQQGFHELGYDPVEAIAAALSTQGQKMDKTIMDALKIGRTYVELQNQAEGMLEGFGGRKPRASDADLEKIDNAISILSAANAAEAKPDDLNMQADEPHDCSGIERLRARLEKCDQDRPMLVHPIIVHGLFGTIDGLRQVLDAERALPAPVDAQPVVDWALKQQWYDEGYNDGKELAPRKTSQPVAGALDELEAFKSWLTTHDPRSFRPMAYSDQVIKLKAWQARAALSTHQVNAVQEDSKDAQRFLYAIALEDNAEKLYASVMNNAPDLDAIRREFDAAITAKQSDN